MSESTKDERDFSRPDTHVCEVARFDNDGHLATPQLQEGEPLNLTDAERAALPGLPPLDDPAWNETATAITAHTDTE